MPCRSESTPLNDTSLECCVPYTGEPLCRTTFAEHYGNLWQLFRAVNGVIVLSIFILGAYRNWTIDPRQTPVLQRVVLRMTLAAAALLVAIMYDPLGFESGMSRKISLFVGDLVTACLWGCVVATGTGAAPYGRRPAGRRRSSAP